MNATDRLLDAAKQKLGITSDYALAKYWNVTPQRIGNWRGGLTGLSNERGIEIAGILGTDPGPILLELEAERARKSGHLDAAAVFESLLRKLGSGLTALLVLFLAVPAPADASPMPFDQSALFRQHLTDNANYAKWHRLRRLIWINFRAAISFFIRPLLYHCRLQTVVQTMTG